jgi:hypothetical protein
MSSEMARLLPTLARFCLPTPVLRRLSPRDLSLYSDSTSAGNLECTRPPRGTKALGCCSGMHTTLQLLAAPGWTSAACVPAQPLGPGADAGAAAAAAEGCDKA